MLLILEQLGNIEKPKNKIKTSGRWLPNRNEQYRSDISELQTGRLEDPGPETLSRPCL